MSLQESMIDELIQLAAEDPVAFEKKKREMIAECINTASTPENRRNLIRIQARIDHERKNFKGDQLHFASRVFSLMAESLLKLHRNVQHCQSISTQINQRMQQEHTPDAK